MIIEAAILLAACLNPEPAPVFEVPELPVASDQTNGEQVTYKVWTDPRYVAGNCFERGVDAILADPRSWSNVRKASEEETPQFWILLTAPMSPCGDDNNPAASCAWNNGDGTGFITFNVMRWNRGYGFDLWSDRGKVVVHEVGHILGFGHYVNSVMGTSPWRPASGSPRWHTDYMNSESIPWPSDAERDIAQLVYVERWKWGGDSLLEWDGSAFTERYGLRSPKEGTSVG